MFLQGVKIENFRAIRKTSISLENGTSLIGENDCGISSVLGALEFVLGHEVRNGDVPDHFFHREDGTERPGGPIRILLRFREQRAGEWAGDGYEPFAPLLKSDTHKPRELWYETLVRPMEDGPPETVQSLRSPGVKGKTTDAKLVGRLRRMNPVIRVSAGMLTGHGQTDSAPAPAADKALKISPEIRTLAGRITGAVEARLSGKSTHLETDLEDGYRAANRLLELGQFKLGKWESGLARSVGEIIGWKPGRAHSADAEPLNNPHSDQERLGVLLMIGALLRARPGGMAPDADPLWILEEPEAHLHPITLSSVAIFVGLIQRQKIITTYSSDLLAAVPLRQVRRLVRHDGELYERRVRRNVLTRSELRRFHYHIRNRFGVASFARMWLLVEGESEFWILPQLARLMGYDFALEGIACVEFAQCGLDPPLKVASELGIEWHVLADGDDAGKAYAGMASRYMDESDRAERLTVLRESDIERFFWKSGYEQVYRRVSKLPGRDLQKLSASRIIRAAVRKQSKPFLALSVVEAVAADGSPGIPPALQKMIETCVDLARRAPERLASGKP